MLNRGFVQKEESATFSTVPTDSGMVGSIAQALSLALYHHGEFYGCIGHGLLYTSSPVHKGTCLHQGTATSFPLWAMRLARRRKRSREALHLF